MICTSRTVTRTIPVGGSPSAVAVDPATHTVYVTAGGFPSVIMDVIQSCR
jgi:DNA-binding beta-propeller fold protein YncE